MTAGQPDSCRLSRLQRPFGSIWHTVADMALLAKCSALPGAVWRLVGLRCLWPQHELCPPAGILPCLRRQRSCQPATVGGTQNKATGQPVMALVFRLCEASPMSAVACLAVARVVREVVVPATMSTGAQVLNEAGFGFELMPFVRNGR